MNSKMLTSRHIIIKIAKFQDKERILKTAREKQEVTYMGAPKCLAADFLPQMLHTKKNSKK